MISSALPARLSRKTSPFGGFSGIAGGSKRAISSLSFRLSFGMFLLIILGLVILFEASASESLSRFGNEWYFLQRQLVWAGLGTVAYFLIGYFIPVAFWKKSAMLFYLAGVALLIVVLIPQIGVEVNGARRWLQFGPLSFQPVELAKLGLVLSLASWLGKHQRIPPFLTFTLVPIILTLLQPDLGSILILLSIACALFIVSGGNLKKFLTLAVMGIIALTVIIFTSPYRRERVQTFLNPESDPLGASYHIRQITIALGNGGVFGLGLGKSRQKYQYIPEVSTDSIFAIVAEETGFIGSVVFLSLFISFFWTCISICRRLIDHTVEYLMAVGITSWLISQLFINISAVVALVPLTGIPLPFISRGGTALIMVMIITGILQALLRSTQEQPAMTPRQKKVPIQIRKR